MSALYNYGSLWIIMGSVAIAHQLPTLTIANHQSVHHNHVGQQMGPLFTLEPPNRIHFSNTSGAVIACSANGVNVRINWILADGSPAIDINSLRYIRSNGELVFPPFPSTQYRQDIHSTTYRCIASNSFGTIRSRDCQVRAVVHQSYKTQVYDEFVIRENTAVMRCQMPTFVREYVRVVTWLKDDSTLITSSLNNGMGFGRYVILNSGELLVRNASKADMGSYRCQTRHELTNEMFTSSVGGRLIVTEPHGTIAPRIWSHSQVKCQEGDSCQLPCIAQSWPPPKYRWYKEEDTALSPVVMNTNIQQFDGTLLLSQVWPQDSGKWVCVANNTLGEERIVVKLVIISAIGVHIEPQRLVADVGKSATFNCSVRGGPINLPVIWLKDGHPLLSDPFSGIAINIDDRIRLIDSNVLYIRSVIRQDSGSYQCLAESEYDSAQGTAEIKLGDIAPVIMEHFSDQIIESSTSLSLRCTASATPLPQIKWFLDDLPVPNFARFRAGDYVTTDAKVVSYVNITSTRVVDGGEYKCVASNDVGQSSHTARISVIGQPSLRSMWTSNNLTVVSGHSIVLSCPVIAYPIESIMWEHKSNQLPVNHRHKVEPIINGIGGKLHISAVHKALDAGEYICTVKGSNSKAVKGSIILTVRLAPQIDGHSLPEEIVTKQGMRVKLMCSIIEGDPPIDIRWFKGHLPVMATETISLQNSEDYSLLTFKSVSHNDMGNWTCKAWNDVQSTNRTVSLVVNVSPNWKVEPKNINVVLAKSVSIDCSAGGSPGPRISWKKSIVSSVAQELGSNDKNVITASLPAMPSLPSDFRDILSSYRHQVYANGTLFIQEVDKSDAGFYMCKISNGIGADLSKVIQLYVQMPPHFEAKFVSEMATKGTTAVLKCRAKGDPVMKAIWQKDKQVVDSTVDKRFTIKEEIISPHSLISYMEIENVGRYDSALFTCIVINNFGTDDTNIQLIVQEVPEPPHEVQVMDITSRSAAVTWKASFSGNNAINKYIVQYKKLCVLDTDWEEITTNTGNDFRAVVRPLHPMCKYELKVRAENSLGRSDPSVMTTFTTNEEVPGGPPQDVMAEATSSTSLKIKWKPPAKHLQYGTIKGYYIGYKVANDNSDQFAYKSVEATPNNDGNRFEMSYISNLKRKTYYTIIIQAYNSVGAGPRTDEIKVLTLESQPPRSPLLEVVTTTVDSITIRWDINELDSEEKEFVLYYREEKTVQWIQKLLKTKRNIFVLDSSDGKTALKCGTKYMLYMTATNSLGTGEPSETITTSTKGSAPVSPSKEEFIYTNSTSVALRLNSWLSGGCLINYFTIKYKLSQQKQWIIIKEKLSNRYEPFYIYQLIPGHDYDLYVGAHTDAGITEAEYQFRTSNTSVVIKIGSMNPPTSVVSQSTTASLSIFQNFTVMLPIVISVIVLIAVLTTLLAFMKRQRSIDQTINNMDARSSIPKSELSSDMFPLSDFVRSNSKPKLFESHTTHPSDIYGKTTAAAATYYATPNRRSSSGLAVANHQLMARHMHNSDHEYAEPLAQYSQPRCLFSDDNECSNLSNTCALMVPNTRL
ncbi:cell adhesion molecule Dscam2-like [Oppia nitens]|uniref:cell adhesion molecule Dscam2-like n=1 Tax=Oppia nitens TaxID=1686743 RepID=UPI0023DA28D0|nr:cell adhesion molecule Dscam2-like [Oppia nitens]